MQHKAVVDDAYFPRSRPEAAWCPPISHQLTCCAMVHPVFPEHNPTMSLLNPVDTHGNMIHTLAAAINFTLFLFSCFLSNVPGKGSSDKLREEYTCVNHFLASFPLLSRLVIISGVGRGVLMTDPAGLRGLQSPGLSTSTLAPSGEIVGKPSSFNQHPLSSRFRWLGFQTRRNGAFNLPTVL